MTDEERKSYLKEFGIRVKTLRQMQGMTLEDLARKCGYTSSYSRSTMQKIEAGLSDIPTSKVEQIADALGVRPGVLMGWEALPDNMVRLSPAEEILIDTWRTIPSEERMLLYAELIKKASIKSEGGERP